jgi:hypothetical protein
MATLAKAAKPPKADYEILVTLKRDHEVVPHIPAILKLGKTVHYRSRTGEVEIKFPKGSPYEYPDGRQKKTVTSNELLKLKRKGIFMGRCYIKMPDGEEYGWGPGYLASGGNHDVQ